MPRSSNASPAGRQDAARSARSADLSSAASPYTGTDWPSHAACPCTGTITVATAATANAAAGWARAIAAASGRARYRARCAQASAGAPAGRTPSRAASGISITLAAVTLARSAAGVISIESAARADTCPKAVTSPSRASTRAASATSPRSAASRITPGSPFPDGRPHV